MTAFNVWAPHAGRVDAEVAGMEVPMSAAGPPIAGLDRLTARDRVHVVHSMGDTFEVMNSVTAANARRAVIIGAGYLGIEMAEALIVRGLEVTQVEQLPEVLPTVDPGLGGMVAAELRVHGVDVVTDTAVRRITLD